MPASETRKNAAKIKQELAALKEARTLNKLVMNEDLEGVFISNPARESETISDDVADKIIKNIEKSGSKNEVEGLSIINRLASGGADRAKKTPIKRARYRKQPRRLKRRLKIRRGALKVKIKKARR